MDQILNDLKNPAWWFSAFVFATIVNVMAGFVKDRVGSYLARYSDAVRQRRAAYLEKRAAAIETLSSDGAYLNIALTHAMAGFVTSSILIIAYLLFLQTAQIKTALCDMAPALAGCSSLNRLSTVLFPAFLGLMAAWFQYKATKRVSLVRAGVKAYRAKHGLSPLL